MKILYVTPLVAGFQDILQGKMESKGLPSFIFPLKKLLEDGNEVDIILISNYKDLIDIQVKWIKNENIIANINNDFSTTKGIKRYAYKLKSLVELYRIIKKVLNEKKYDFVYCHGTAGYLGNVLANRSKIRCGYRIYGVVNVADDIKHIGVCRSIIKYPIYYKIFTKKKDFLLITDDGTDGDYVFKIFNPKKTFPMYYFLNGVDKSFKHVSQRKILEEINCIGEKYIFHAGRIVKIKRQDRVIKLLHMLHLNGCKIHLLFAGHISDKIFYEELLKIIHEYELEKYIHFIGAIERSDLQSLSHDALATILLGDSSNQGNVFFECAIAGSIIITFPEKSLKKYIVDKESGFFVKDEEDAVTIILDLYHRQYETTTIREKIIQSVDRQLPSWNERIQMEVDLIYGGVK